MLTICHQLAVSHDKTRSDTADPDSSVGRKLRLKGFNKSGWMHGEYVAWTFMSEILPVSIPLPDESRFTITFALTAFRGYATDMNVHPTTQEA